MKRRIPDLLERAVAGAVILAGVGSSFWLQWDAAMLDRAVVARRAQLDHLRTMAAPRCANLALVAGPEIAGPSSTASLTGVFPKHRVVWLHTSAGCVLGIEASKVMP